MKCPKCGSKEIEIVDEEMGFIRCKKCGFNELDEYENVEGGRNTQREKARFNPYKTGGGRRNK